MILLQSATINGMVHAADDEYVQTVVMRTDGHGPMGRYDMVYVYVDGSEEEMEEDGDSGWVVACPLHHCQEVTR